MRAGDVAAALDKGLVVGAMSTAAMTLGSTTEMEPARAGAEVGLGRGRSQAGRDADRRGGRGPERPIPVGLAAG